MTQQVFQLRLATALQSSDSSYSRYTSFACLPGFRCRRRVLEGRLVCRLSVPRASPCTFSPVLGHMAQKKESEGEALRAGTCIAGAQEQEGWLLAGWQRSKYDEDAGPSLGVIVNIDRVVVVTGVSSGIGYGVAKTLIAHQCHIFGRQALSSL